MLEARKRRKKMTIEFSKEMIESLITNFGTNSAVEALVSACRVAIESAVADFEKE
jgi:hypothetical protein